MLKNYLLAIFVTLTAGTASAGLGFSLGHYPAPPETESNIPSKPQTSLAVYTMNDWHDELSEALPTKRTHILETTELPIDADIYLVEAPVAAHFAATKELSKKFIQALQTKSVIFFNCKEEHIVCLGRKIIMPDETTMRLEQISTIQTPEVECELPRNTSLMECYAHGKLFQQLMYAQTSPTPSAYPDATCSPLGITSLDAETLFTAAIEMLTNVNGVHSAAKQERRA